jgi:ABC-2 type transport system permease protein
MVGVEPAVQPAGFLSRRARQQYAALAWVQTRMFFNSLRTRRGTFELGARVVTVVVFAAVALGPSIGLGFGAWAMTAQGHLQTVALLLWVLFLAWQGFSALAPALAGQNPELSHLLRFPVSFGSWILLYLIYGIAAPSTLIGLLWTTAIGIGVSVARPAIGGWVAITLLVFAVFNLLLSRTILAWIERWLAQRRTREIVTGLFLVFALAAQALNPAFHPNYRYTRQKHAVAQAFEQVSRVQGVFPPGLALSTCVDAEQGNDLEAAESLLALVLYALGTAGLLAVRLRAESRGENLGEAPRRSSGVRASRTRSSLIDFSGPVAAVFEKDLRYLLRSGPMLYNLAVPLVMVVVFGGGMRSGALSGLRLTYALPLGMIWAFLGLTRLISNNLGAEGEGIQFFFLAPTPMRTVILGKNLLHLTLFGLEAVAITVLVVVRFGWPDASIVAATVAWILFAVPANFAVGNLLSIRMPYRMNLTRMRREPGALGNGLSSMLMQLILIGVGGVVIAGCTVLGHPWVAIPVLLLLAGISVTAYMHVLAGVNGMVEQRRDALTLEVMKIRS